MENVRPHRHFPPTLWQKHTTLMLIKEVADKNHHNLNNIEPLTMFVQEEEPGGDRDP